MIRIFLFMVMSYTGSPWGFFGHRMITRLAVFSLPEEIYPFFRTQIQQLSNLSVKPDQRRYSVPWEAQRHYLDMDAYPDSVISTWMAEPAYGDSIDSEFRRQHGDLPRQVLIHKRLLTNAMISGNYDRIIVLAAELSHYISDAHVPLHTTSNYDGQETGQEGIHGLWESRIPELFIKDFDLFTRRARYIDDPHDLIWEILTESNLVVDSVLAIEKVVRSDLKGRIMAHDQRGKTTLRQFSPEYAKRYNNSLNGMVERRMRTAAERVADFWYTCWMDAGMPDLSDPPDLKTDSVETQINGVHTGRFFGIDD